MRKSRAKNTAARIEEFERARAEAREHARAPSAYFLDKVAAESGYGFASGHSALPLVRREMGPELVPKSRMLSRVLRHKPELWGVELDREGWCEVDALLAGAASHGQDLSLAQLHEIVETNDKRRFTLSPDGLRIRAAQGHSVPVDLKLRTTVPPPVLYHGTVRKHLPGIRREGLLPMRRHAVHLSATKEAAAAVGGRRGVPVVLIVDSYAMNRDGFEFKLAQNGVWLTAAVPSRYLNLSHLPGEPPYLPTGSRLKALTPSEHQRIAGASPSTRGKVVASLLPEGEASPEVVQRDATEDE